MNSLAIGVFGIGLGLSIAFEFPFYFLWKREEAEGKRRGNSSAKYKNIFRKYQLSQTVAALQTLLKSGK